MTASFGSGSKEGETLIASGHVSEEEFNRKDDNGRHVGHDHYGGKGNSGDRGCYQNDKWADENNS